MLLPVMVNLLVYEKARARVNSTQKRPRISFVSIPPGVLEPSQPVSADFARCVLRPPLPCCWCALAHQERGLRAMTRMQGLGDGAYWLCAHTNPTPLHNKIPSSSDCCVNSCLDPSFSPHPSLTPTQHTIPQHENTTHNRINYGYYTLVQFAFLLLCWAFGAALRVGLFVVTRKGVIVVFFILFTNVQARCVVLCVVRCALYCVEISPPPPPLL